jgi:hypothetical protein
LYIREVKFALLYSYDANRKHHKRYLLREVTSLESDYKDTITKYPDTAYAVKLGHEALGKFVILACCTAVGVA